jgi:two-component system response regulator AtoC
MSPMKTGINGRESGNESQRMSERSDRLTRGLTPIRVLLVDDEPEVLWSLINCLEDEGYQVEVAERAKDALRVIPEYQPQIVFLDVKMPGMSGLEALERIRIQYQDIITFILTGHESIKDAVQAIKTGAYDYFSKPYHLEDIKFSILRALERKSLKEEVVMLRKKLQETFDFSAIVTADPKMFEIFDKLRKVAQSDLSVLITGENGTGKELMAQAIHYNSDRKAGPFAPMDCAAIPETLFESEVFGYDKGAFTGAENRRRGLFEMAHGGTLFLDELGNLKPDSQSKLLRAIQERKILPLGGKAYVNLDIRIISATNTDLVAVKEKGGFREDLYFRINEFHVHLPPLRERPDDVPLLSKHFLNEKAKGTDGQIKEISEEAMDILMKYSWPGNIRQLKTMIHRASVLAETKILPEHLSSELLSGHRSGKGTRISLYIPKGSPFKLMEEKVLTQAGKAYIERVLEECNYNKKQASILLGIPCKSLDQLIGEYNIKTDPVMDEFSNECFGENLKPGMTLKDLNTKIGFKVERILIINAIHKAGGNKAKAARDLKIDYKTLHCKINEYKISKENNKPIQPPKCVTDILSKEPSCPFKKLISQVRQEMEKGLILITLGATGWDKAKAARRLDIDYKTLYNKMVLYGLMRKN